MMMFIQQDLVLHPPKTGIIKLRMKSQAEQQPASFPRRSAKFGSWFLANIQHVIKRGRCFILVDYQLIRGLCAKHKL